VPELLDAGVTVMLGSDGTAPDRGYDMFRHMWQCMHYHRRHFRDTGVLPPGKVLEMATIDAARALGLDRDIGSLETGKRADVILVDLAKPHLYPLNMPVYRVMYFANGADVDTVLVDGKVLMEGRKVLTVNEADVLESAQQEAERMLDRTGLRHLTEFPPKFWGHSRYPV
jgi:cytosine/adenosine deaminase-related metal-dependent hydrolase